MRGRRRLLVAQSIQAIALFLLSVSSSLRVAIGSGPSSPTTLWESLHVLFLRYYAIGFFIASLTATVAMVFTLIFNNESKVRLKAVLDVLHEAYFADVPEEQKYLNRVTLFKANWRDRKLKSLCRSGNPAQRRAQSLRIDANNEAHNEGIAGQAWYRNTTVRHNDLPACPDVWSDGDPICKDYAQKGLLPLRKAKKLKVKSRSVLATPVRDFKGNLWGVLALDSRSPDSMQPAGDHLVTSFARALGNIVG